MATSAGWFGGYGGVFFVPYHRDNSEAAEKAGTNTVRIGGEDFSSKDGYAVVSLWRTNMPSVQGLISPVVWLSRGVGRFRSL